MPPVATEAVEGEIVTEVTPGVGEGAVTVTFMDDDLVGSALLVAVTTDVPALEGAVNNPEGAMVPNEAFQVTDLSVAVP